MVLGGEEGPRVLLGLAGKHRATQPSLFFSDGGHQLRVGTAYDLAYVLQLGATPRCEKRISRRNTEVVHDLIPSMGGSAYFLIIPHLFTIVYYYVKLFTQKCNVRKRLNMPSLKELERWVGTTEAAKRIGYSRQGVINLAEDKKVRAVRTGAGWIYDPDDLELFKARMKASKVG